MRKGEKVRISHQLVIAIQWASRGARLRALTNQGSPRPVRYACALFGVRCSVFARRLGTNSIILEAGTDADRRLKQAFEAAVLARAPKTHRAAF